MTALDLRHVYETLHDEATRLAGGLPDLTQRATTYHYIFRDSAANHIFPLIAAHGALWARGYFRFGMRLGRILAWQYGFDSATRNRQLQSLGEFADAFREINRRVCVDTYANYHFTARHGEHSAAAEFVPPQLLEALNRVHAARRRGRELTDAERRDVFVAHFLHEQRHVVGPRIETALTSFDWPLMKFIALRPLIRFAFFPAGQFLWFGNFARREERIEKGLTAFEIGARAGWTTVERALRHYAVLPAPFFDAPVEYFASLRQSLLVGEGR